MLICWLLLIWNNQVISVDYLSICENYNHFFYIKGIVGYNACEGRPRIEEWLHYVKLAVKPFYDDSHDDIRKLAETTGNNFDVKATAKNC